MTSAHVQMLKFAANPTLGISYAGHITRTTKPMCNVQDLLGLGQLMICFDLPSPPVLLRAAVVFVAGQCRPTVPGSISGWWFGTFFIFPYVGNNHPN